jgi:hypothetical protein
MKVELVPLDQLLPEGVKPIRLPKTIKTRWLKALRSGKYKQGPGYLKQGYADYPDDPEKYCCLGVLCYMPRSPVDLSFAGMGESIEEDMVSKALYRVLDQTTLDHDSCGSTVQGYLILLNDQGASFADIADWIEENL